MNSPLTFRHDEEAQSYTATWEDCILVASALATTAQEPLVADVRASLPTGALLNRKRLGLLNTWACQQFALLCDSRRDAQLKMEQYLAAFADQIQQAVEAMAQMLGTEAAETTKGTHEETQDVCDLLSTYGDEEFIEQLAYVATMHQTDETNQRGPRVVYRPEMLARLATIRQTSSELFDGVFLAKLRLDRRFNIADLLNKLQALGRKSSSTLPPPETLTHLLADTIPTPVALAQGLLHEGMLLFGGKSKRGKSWLMFDLAIALAVGRSAFQHYPCPKPTPVLYLALEDGRARLQGRARMIQPNLTTADHLHLRYTFPPLNEGGIELLTQEILTYHYGLVVIDVLAKVEGKGNGRGERNYHEVYDMFAPLQALRQKHPFCLAMLTHLRKQEADDAFDGLHGSVAYQGAQDYLWVLERKPKDDFAFLHVRDKDAEDMTIALRFTDGHWEYVGEGEEYEVTRDQRKVITILTEERRELGIPEILKAGGFPDARYGYLRKLLVTMVKDDLIHRTRHGKYCATVQGEREYGTPDDADELEPF